MAIQNELPWLMPDTDVLYYHGHGSPHGWSAVIDSHLDADEEEAVFPIDFNNHNPIVLATTCLSGDYQSGGADEYRNIAESFLASGAAVYVGATEEASIGVGGEAAKRLFDPDTPQVPDTPRDYWDANESFGKAFTELERSHWNGPDQNWRYWITEFNIYGDPKFGQVSSAGSENVPSLAESSTPPSSLEVAVPDYVVNVNGFGEGLDYVEIPGGRLWQGEGQYQVPFYSTSVDLSPGYRVQDVVLTERSGLVTDTGLNIPIATMEEGSSGLSSQPASSEGEGWFPEEDYQWVITENPDGSSTLVILMYPFYYNALTTDVRFYKNYSFDIDYTVSPVTITELTTDKDEYPQGDIVLVDIGLNNSGEPQDVIVSAVVKGYGSGETVDGLLLTTLEELAGAASFSPQWDSSGFEPGYYYVEVTLEDTAGNVLDRQTEMFRLGIYSGEVTAFTAAPEYFQMGDDIEIDMTFSNTGTVNISGSAVIRVLGPTGDVVDEFVHDITDLMPSESISFDDMWHASEAEKGSYNVVGYVSYDSQATEPAVVTLRTVCGDVDCDGDVDAVDALFILQYVVGLRSPSDECPPPEGQLYLPGADVDCDDDVDAVDALFALQHVVGLRPELCVCPEP